MANLRDLKAFVRYDGSGRVVAGSLIFRKSKPKVGNFQQINSFKCCNFDQSPVVVEVQSGFPFTYPDFVLSGTGGVGQYIYTYGNNTSVADIYELAAYLESKLQYLGTFKVVDGDLIFNPNASTAELFAASGATSLSASTFAD